MRRPVSIANKHVSALLSKSNHTSLEVPVHAFDLEVPVHAFDFLSPTVLRTS